MKVHSRLTVPTRQMCARMLLTPSCPTPTISQSMATTLVRLPHREMPPRLRNWGQKEEQARSVHTEGTYLVLLLKGFGLFTVWSSTPSTFVFTVLPSPPDPVALRWYFRGDSVCQPAPIPLGQEHSSAPDRCCPANLQLSAAANWDCTPESSLVLVLARTSYFLFYY